MNGFNREIVEIDISFGANDRDGPETRVRENPLLQFVGSTTLFVFLSVYVASILATIGYSFERSAFFEVDDNPFSFDTLLVVIPLLAGYYYFLSEEKGNSFSDRSERVRIKELLSVSIFFLLLFGVVSQILSGLPGEPPEGWVTMDETEGADSTIKNALFGLFRALIVNFGLTVQYSFTYVSLLYLFGVCVGLEILRLSGGALSRSSEGKRDSEAALKRKIVDLNRAVKNLFRRRLPGDSLRLALHTNFESLPLWKRWLLLVGHFIARFTANLFFCALVLWIVDLARGEEGYTLALLPFSISLFLLPSIELWFSESSKFLALCGGLWGMGLLLLGMYGLGLEKAYILLVSCTLVPFVFWVFQFFCVAALTWGPRRGAIGRGQRVRISEKEALLGSSDFKFATGVMNKTKWRFWGREKNRISIFWWLLCFNGRLGHRAAISLDQLLEYRQDAIERIQELKDSPTNKAEEVTE